MGRLGFLPYTISIQNEPQHSDNSYPTMQLSVSQEAAVGVALRRLLDNNGFSRVKIIGYDHNWNNAATYPVQLMQQAEAAFTGAAFHCYEGVVSQQLDVNYGTRGYQFDELTSPSSSTIGIPTRRYTSQNVLAHWARIGGAI